MYRYPHANVVHMTSFETYNLTLAQRPSVIPPNARKCRLLVTTRRLMKRKSRNRRVRSTRKRKVGDMIVEPGVVM